ncbi:aminoacetone oxidase family FAD-binding enzyme [Olivibacter sp. XZL3]|uniref:NAD(P)/FAD-dependent oxidoreductase n=1 Tax=Olivibacter sp. XZL3 TaxID=1735116 RepID=UPI0010660EA3|nr:aminoacetone oxidase family FAD-binding enzyme [Olivibacter sp. XZL3]
MNYDALIIGGGACGLMCAVQAGYLGKRVAILERNDKLGAKILISGGGRCNYTNLYASPTNFISENKHFSIATLNQWTVDDTIQFFEQQGIIGQEKTLGQLFPTSNKAKDIVAAFERLLKELGQEVFLQAEVKAIEKNPGSGTFQVTFNHKDRLETLEAPKVVMASGGLPVAKLGASDFSLRIAKQFGLDVTATAPALVPLTITGKGAEWFSALAGNSIFSRVWNNRISFEENILFTHWGLSGPAILQISSYWNPSELIWIDLLPKQRIAQLIQQERERGGKRLLSQLLQDHFTKKFTEALGKFLPVDKKVASIGKQEVKYMEQVIHRFEVKPAGSKGYDKAEVMRGGVNTDELLPKSLESKKCEGLFFGGECVDVTGWLGGYNFQWAWASGYVIAQHL